MRITSAVWDKQTISPDELLYRAQLRLCGMPELDTDVWLASFDCLATLRAQVSLSSEAIELA